MDSPGEGGGRYWSMEGNDKEGRKVLRRGKGSSEVWKATTKKVEKKARWGGERGMRVD